MRSDAAPRGELSNTVHLCKTASIEGVICLMCAGAWLTSLRGQAAGRIGLVVLHEANRHVQRRTGLVFFAIVMSSSVISLMII